MRTVELAPGVKSSVLGFGCAPILGAIGRRRAEAALGTALDLGVTHLDVAPSYGFGEAEGFLGRFLRGRRDSVVLATKFGIEPSTMASLLTPLKPLARVLWRGRKVPVAPSRESESRPPNLGRFFRRAHLNATDLQQSVDRSLRALRTDWIDVLLLHEPLLPMKAWPEMRMTAERLRQQGKIRAFGVAFSRLHGHPGEEVLRECDVRQFDCSPVALDYAAVVAAAGSKPGILFAPFARVDQTLDRTAILRRLFTDFPRSVVLCSMFTKEHIQANVRVAETARDPESMEPFRA